MKQFSENTYWTLAENLKHLKGQERSPCNQVGWNGVGGGGEARRTRPTPTGGNRKKREVPWILRSPLTSREISWDRKSTSEVQRRMQQLVLWGIFAVDYVNNRIFLVWFYRMIFQNCHHTKGRDWRTYQKMQTFLLLFSCLRFVWSF